jgi:hypothetical protein
MAAVVLVALSAVAYGAPPASQPAVLMSGTFGDCDPHIVDKLVGAEWRSPSSCEVKFDSNVLQALVPAVAPVVSAMTAAGWVETKKPRLDAIDAIPRHSEKKPFELVNRGGGAFDYAFSVKQDSPEYQRLNKVAMDKMQEAIGQALKGGAAPDPGKMEEAQEASRALQEASLLDMSIVINEASWEAVSFKGGHTVRPLPGGGFSIEVPYAQPPTGGGEDAAVRVTYVFLGAWGAAPASTTGGKDQTISVKGALNPAKLLVVQNLRIRIQGGSEQTQKVTQLMDWAALRQLIAQ